MCRPQLAADGVTGKHAMKQLGALWRELPAEDQEPFRAQAARDKERYAKERAVHKEAARFRREARRAKRAGAVEDAGPSKGAGRVKLIFWDNI